TDSASALPIPKDFKATPEKVGSGLAKNIHSNSFIITNSFSQNLQIKFDMLEIIEFIVAFLKIQIHWKK
ncbi:MAG: hypothetical protein GXY89_01025, partial [Tissierellia bacterium]|nr:hypothetical protein [Tissierellia bacterium]